MPPDRITRLEKSAEIMRYRQNWIKVINRYKQFAQRHSKDSVLMNPFILLASFIPPHRFSKNQDINVAIETYHTCQKFPEPSRR
jgi:hypothetical protein